MRYRELFPDRSIEVIGYGPGAEKSAHIVNESIGLDEVRRSTPACRDPLALLA